MSIFSTIFALEMWDDNVVNALSNDRNAVPLRHKNNKSTY